MEQKNKKIKVKWSLKKRIFITVTVLCLLGIISVIVIDRYVCLSMKKYILTKEEAATLENVDCILVLGAGVRGDEPSPMLRDRIDMGISLYHSNAAGKILMSGDHSRPDYNEVAVMKRIAVSKGVLSSDVFMDHAGFSTYESAFRAKNIFQAEKIIIVTQSYHMYRALYDARKKGIEAYGVCTGYDYTGLGQTKRDIREVAARVKDFFFCMFQAGVTYEGEVIPVSGNGDCTND